MVGGDTVFNLPANESNQRLSASAAMALTNTSVSQRAVVNVSRNFLYFPPKTFEAPKTYLKQVFRLQIPHFLLKPSKSFTI